MGDSTAISKVAERLESAGIDFASDDSLITVHDPWGHVVMLRA